MSGVAHITRAGAELVACLPGQGPMTGTETLTSGFWTVRIRIQRMNDVRRDISGVLPNDTPVSMLNSTAPWLSVRMKKCGLVILLAAKTCGPRPHLASMSASGTPHCRK